MLPACVTCNESLERRFETPTKNALRKLFDPGGSRTLTAPEADDVGLWFVKTCLLLVHPAARPSDPGFHPTPWDLGSVDDDLYTWMIGRVPPPAALSLWICRRADSTELPTTPAHEVPLPTIVADARRLASRSRGIGLADVNARLVYHPGCEIVHPHEADGRAVRLWPPQRQPVDFGALPAVNPNEISWASGPTLHFAPGTFDEAALPALSSLVELQSWMAPGRVTFVTW
jgi:hypothetical protein